LFNIASKKLSEKERFNAELLLVVANEDVEKESLPIEFTTLSDVAGQLAPA
jgi:hypothetical protein